MYFYAKPQEYRDIKYEIAQSIFNKKESNEKVEFAFCYYEDKVYDIILEDLYQKFPDKDFTYSDVDEMNSDEAWDIISRSYLYNKIIAKFFQEEFK